MAEQPNAPVLGQGESVVREGDADYTGGHTTKGEKIKGKLILSNKRIRFDYTSKAGMFRTRTDVLFNVTVDKIVACRIEKMSILGAKGLKIEFEDRNGIMQHPIFKIQDPDGWVSAINQIMAG